MDLGVRPIISFLDKRTEADPLGCCGKGGGRLHPPEGSAAGHRRLAALPLPATLPASAQGGLSSPALAAAACLALPLCHRSRSRSNWHLFISLDLRLHAWPSRLPIVPPSINLEICLAPHLGGRSLLEA